MKNNTPKLSSNKGITLIALVITIIVLLILAGITLNSLLGQNGIMTQAEHSQKLYNESSVVEYISLKIAGATTESEKTILDKLHEIDDIEIEETGKDVYYVTKDGYTITIYENGEIIEGTVDVWDDTSLEMPELDNEFNWYIYNCAQLKFLADFVNNGNVLTDNQKIIVQNKGYNEADITINNETTVYLMNNLDLGARFTENGELLSGAQWIPIGSQNIWFQGKFEGNNHYISGVYVNQEVYGGIFGDSNEIRNLTIKDSYIKGEQLIGGISAISDVLINCHNENTVVTGIILVGGVSGQGVKRVENCTNNGTVIGSREAGYVGGIIGVTTMAQEGNTIILNCTNNGRVYGSYSLLAGITAMATCGTIENCTNNGYIGDEEVLAIGGIVADSRGLIKNCINNGKVAGAETIGGIVGSMNLGNVENCTNNGYISSTGNRVGGICGSVNPVEESYKVIKKCVNNGLIESFEPAVYCAGIVGIITTDSNDPSEGGTATIVDCYNTSKIKGYQTVAGIVGGTTQYNSIIEKCYNLGEIEGTLNIAGITGQLGRSSKIKNCYNVAVISGVRRMGGMTGYTYGSAGEIINSYNLGKVNGEETFGGLVGENGNEVVITNSYYLEGTANTDDGKSASANFSKTAEYIKTTFMQNANSPEVLWEIREGENNNFPVLIKK